MELKEAIGIRRTIRFYNPYRTVEREKIQKMLEAARLSSFWGNVQALRAIVMFRESCPPEKWQSLIAPLGTSQLQHAPVAILWYWVEEAILDSKTGHLTQGDRLHELVAARAIGLNEAEEHKALDQFLIPYFRINAPGLMKSGLTDMDCGQAIGHATLIAFEEGLGTCCIGTGGAEGPRERRMRKAFNLPDSAHLLVVMTVGYPLESREAGGQRPKLPFEQLYFLNEHGKPFERDPKVVEELKQAKMIQAPSPLPWRQQELEFVHKALGIVRTGEPMANLFPPEPEKK
ncbi:MAG TPA: nitroreductase family protein [Candidatus Binataceae bacterium]|nr:nitroreductase family protein [Candidatus Binataceae bacterium]